MPQSGGSTAWLQVAGGDGLERRSRVVSPHGSSRAGRRRAVRLQESLLRTVPAEVPASAAISSAGRRGPDRPDLLREQELWDGGARVVVGLDEVGRGAWAGPLVVAAVALHAGGNHDAFAEGVRDSKQLRPAQRERLSVLVEESCEGWGVGGASAAECDELGMSAAQRLAAARALESLTVCADSVLLDGRWDFVTPAPGSPTAPVGGFDGPVHTVVGGDARCVSLAAASILAKVWRDRRMVQDASRYPAYDFDRNKGYPCPRHRAALAAWGPSAIHRRTWAFMQHLPSGEPTGVGSDAQLRLLDHR